MPFIEIQFFNSTLKGNIGQSLTTVARQTYEKDYKEEIELNEEFNLFVTNYQLAHQGPNTLKGQIDARVKNASKTRKFIVVPDTSL